MRNIENCKGMKKSWNLTYKLDKTLKKEWIKKFNEWWDSPPKGRPREYPKTLWLKLMKVPFNTNIGINMMLVIETGLYNLFGKEIKNSNSNLKIETRHIKRWLKTGGDGIVQNDNPDYPVIEFCVRGYEGAILS